MQFTNSASHCSTAVSDWDVQLNIELRRCISMYNTSSRKPMTFESSNSVYTGFHPTDEK